MVSMLDELKERNILKLILIMRFACATLDVGHPIHNKSQMMGKVTSSSFVSHKSTQKGQDID
jgi:hypothetical protein